MIPRRSTWTAIYNIPLLFFKLTTSSIIFDMLSLIKEPQTSQNETETHSLRVISQLTDSRRASFPSCHRAFTFIRTIIKLSRGSLAHQNQAPPTEIRSCTHAKRSASGRLVNYNRASAGSYVNPLNNIVETSSVLPRLCVGVYLPMISRGFPGYARTRRNHRAGRERKQTR